MMTPARSLPAFLLLIAFAACSDGTVALSYRLDTGDKARYLWTVETTTAKDTAQGQGIETTTSVLSVLEEVVPGGENRTQVRLTVTPESHSHNGVRLVAPPPFEVTLKVDPVSGSTSVLTGLEGTGEEVIRSLSEFRPPLPDGRVGIGDRWPVRVRTRAGETFIDLKGAGRLTGFAFGDRRRLAIIEFERMGRVAKEERGRFPVKLEGSSSVLTILHLDQDHGVPYFSDTTSTTAFDLQHADARNIGSVVITIRTRVERVVEN